GGGKVYIDSATFEGRQVSLSSDSGSTPATTFYVSRTTAPSWRVNTVHSVYFGKDMDGAIKTEDGYVNFTKYATTVFDADYVASLAK
ncbi:MAG: hypothetical protein II328_01590, partial [Clostridia bacterium]|nr:hypothetical protein [Clostridia bacterium]